MVQRCLVRVRPILGRLRGCLSRVLLTLSQLNAQCGDRVQVCEVKWVTLDEVRAGMDREPTAYTEWFRREMALVYPRLSSAKLRA